MKKVIAVLLLLAAWVLWANTAIEVNEWIIESPEIPAGFDGFRIAQISDLHNAEFGEGNQKLLDLLESAEPDIIVITGDMIDSRNTDVEVALAFVEAALEIAPCYYVSGNHESRVPEWEALRAGLIDAGVIVLEEEAVTLERGGDAVTLVGVQDPTFHRNFDGELYGLAGEGYTILLSHRPEKLELYARFGFDLVFSGHAHGGQVRIPFVGGLVAPHQGFFPDYDSGLYQRNGTAMLVSRGLGNSIIPLRINNRPEIIVAILNCA